MNIELLWSDLVDTCLTPTPWEFFLLVNLMPVSMVKYIVFLLFGREICIANVRYVSLFNDRYPIPFRSLSIVNILHTTAGNKRGLDLSNPTRSRS